MKEIKNAQAGDVVDTCWIDDAQMTGYRCEKKRPSFLLRREKHAHVDQQFFFKLRNAASVPVCVSSRLRNSDIICVVLLMPR